MPFLEEAKTLGLGEVEYKNILNKSSDSVNTLLITKSCMGKYTKFSNDNCATIKKYTLEKDNE